KKRFGKANNELIKTQLSVLFIFAFMNPVMNALMYIAVIIILLVGSIEVKNGVASPGTIMAAITYTTQMLNGILMLVMLFQNISRGLASWKRVKEVLDTAPHLKEGDFDGDTEIHGKIEFKDVSFSYPDTNQIVLSHINLTVNPGETIAIMGSTGCGKSTLVNLIPRFYDATDGCVLVDGIDVREYNQKNLRSRIAFAMQKSELFSVSVKENIAWGLPTADDDQTRLSCEIAQADEFINSMPDKYDTPVAERGMSLSGGQKQRVSVSRAVLKPAEILILDDSTSALDLKTEANLYNALDKSKPEITKIIIAQRIASARRADRIVVLDNGKIVSFGTHDELLKSCSIYKDIYYSQIGEEGECDE
ncbi:MAG: ABC transporter ATP-binding protein, partial [Eubacterium sp.]